MVDDETVGNTEKVDRPTDRQPVEAASTAAPSTPDLDSSDSISASTEITREELRTTFEYQVQRLGEIDSKAIEILKANLLLIGLVVTGGSVLIQTDLPVDTFINLFTITGGLLLLGSTGLSAVTYTASNLRGGLDSEAVEAAVAADDDSAAFETQLLRSYAQWIEYNARVTAVNDLLATITVLLVFVAFVYVVAGIAVGGAGLSTLGELVAFGLVSLLMAGFTWAGFHMDHLGHDADNHPETFAGVRLSKGATRKEGIAALGDMLTRSNEERERGE